MASTKLNNIYIKDAFTLAGPMETNGALTGYDLLMNDFYYHEKTFEQAEIKMQKVVMDNLLFRNHLVHSEISTLVGGDLSNQISTSSYAASNYPIPFIGCYSACASFIEGLILGSLSIEADKNGKSIVVTSSHNLHAEKQFRYPIEYGAPKPLTTTFTATGAVAALLTHEKCPIKIESYTIGEVSDMGCKDATHMGAVMAPAAGNTIMHHLMDLKRDINYYDLILTGDLGCIGAKILKEYLKRAYGIKLKHHLDAGCELYLPTQKETYAGASGPVTLPLYFFTKIAKEKKAHKILLVGTGSLHNPFFVNQKLTIPSIAHAISLEVGM